jgi:hypothetical protein
MKEVRIMMKFRDLIKRLDETEDERFKAYSYLLEYLVEKGSLNEEESYILLDRVSNYDEIMRKQFSDMILYKYLDGSDRIVEKWFSN